MTGTGIVRSFEGQVVRGAWAARVVSPLHDVLTSAERRAVLAANPDTYLHVTSDPEDLPSARSGPSPSEANSAALQRLLAAGAYDERRPDRLFVYLMTEGSVQHASVVATVDVRGFEDGGVLGHEGVQPDRVEGLVRHFDAVRCRSELVSLMHRADPVIAQLVAEVQASPPLLELVDFSGVEQLVWEVDPPRRESLVRHLGQQQLYIADGHHRVAASIRRWQRDGRPGRSSVLCAIYPEDQIRLLAFHRRVRGPVDAPALLDGIGERFDVRPVAGPTASPGAIGLYAGGEWWRLTPLVASRSAGVAGLDVTMLQDQILRPLLGVGVQDGDPQLEFIPELLRIEESLARCDDDGGVLFAVHAPGVEDVVAVAQRGEVMSPKSTYVQPKPRTGIFLS
jgi:uncharacterized protein (DUF1015 family)